LAASLASAVDDLGPRATFCSESGCDQVRHSWWAHPVGVPMWLVGVVFYVAMVSLAFAERHQVVRRVLAIAGGVWGATLIVIQGASIGAWCKLCLVADPSAIVLAGCALLGARAVKLTGKSFGATAGGIAVAVLVLAAWTHRSSPPLPEGGPMPPAIAKEQVPGEVTIVEFVDFECPFCRDNQKRLEEAIARSDVHVHLVRKMFPLPIHPHSIYAAVCYVRAEMQGKGDAVASALFAADPDDLSSKKVEELAVKLGVGDKRYEADFTTGKDRVLGDIHLAQSLDIDHLPTVYIGSVRVVGTSLDVPDLVELIASQAP
jgi:uncharacterized membrane protein